MDTHHDQKHPREGRRIGGLIDELRAEAAGLSAEQRERLRHHLEDLNRAEETKTRRGRATAGDQGIRPDALRIGKGGRHRANDHRPVHAPGRRSSAS